MPTDIAGQFDLPRPRHRTSPATFPTEADRKRLAAWKAHWLTHCKNHPERAIAEGGKDDRYCGECLHEARNRGAAEADATWADLIITETVKVWVSSKGGLPGAGHYRYYRQTTRIK